MPGMVAFYEFYVWLLECRYVWYVFGCWKYLSSPSSFFVEINPFAKSKHVLRFLPLKFHFWMGLKAQRNQRSWIGQFQKYHNTLCFLSLQNFAWVLLLYSLGTIVSPRRKWKQCLCKILEGQTKSIMVFLKVTYTVHPRCVTGYTHYSQESNTKLNFLVKSQFLRQKRDLRHISVSFHRIYVN